ncbi:zinc finger and BTB domain-containing protein 41 [Notechis scutatus]|uniref:Zinc finger and BTB domain-containing protein 41 n=1 Tax=Notechis scutatus TaxID=8663 RepID=A0A6J1U9C8_9SAUR|nr:zinc finger and BTB domain-containing protein 41 [Notechis scutatus]
MKKKRRLNVNVDDKIHLGHRREQTDKIPVTDSEQEAHVDSAEVATADQLIHSKELSLLPDQRKLLTSLQYNKNLLKYLNDDRRKQPSFCDLLIIVDGKEFSSHKVVVAVGSSYFHAYLSKNPNTNVITLDHVTHSVFHHLLEFLYTSQFFLNKNEIPLILEAAKFLDIIDAVKLLNSENVSISQSEEKTKNPSQVEQTTEQTSKIATNHQCTLCNRNFCYKKSLENHLSKAHKSSAREKEHGRKMVEKSVISTRRSMRNRKCLAKFDQSDNESGNASETNLDTIVPSQESNESEDSGSEYNTDGQEEDTLGDDTESEQHSEKECGEVHEPDGAAGNISEDNLSTCIPHILQNSSKKCLQCPKCDKTFDRPGKFESHARVHTGEKPFECDICQQRYSTKSNLTVHRKKHSSEMEFHKKEHKCSYCNKLHATKKTLIKHKKRFHPENVQEFLPTRKKKSEGWKCEICNKSFTRRPHLEEHRILHTQNKPFKCTYCEEHFKSRFTRLKHQEKFHLGPFPCDICGRQFNDTGNLKRHIECTHGGKRKWTCFICGKSVRERTTLKEHLRIHSGEKPHLCSICGQSFRHGSSYRLHLRVHHDDKRYECEECGKTFIRHDHLTKHKKIHSGEKAHQCEECGKCFGRRDHLTVHYKSVHLGEKVWQKYKATFHPCEVCKKVFKGKSSLEMHFRTHSGEKPYKCQICNQSFRIKKTLTKHMVIHSDARPFNCKYCNSTFKRKDKLKYHTDHVHGGKSTEELQNSLSEEKIVTLPAQYPSDDKAFQGDSKPFVNQNTTYQVDTKAMLQNVPSDTRVPVTLISVRMRETQSDLVQQQPPVISSSHSILPPQPPPTDYQQATELEFLEKYTLTPQPANIVHPVKPEQILDSREQTSLGMLLGIDSAHSVQNISNNEH